MYFYWQQAGGEDLWQEGLAASRQHIIETKRPRYVTVLDLSAFVSDSMSREDINEIKYRGPMYFDWDAPEIETGIEKVQQFLGKLHEADVDLSALRLYATGGRGFHCEMPMEMFMAKIPVKGVQYLPAICKELAFELYTDTMDLRVYSARRGRMWRTPNVQRENGAYKVPITAAEMDAMTPTMYASLCSAPREAPASATPVLNMKLAVIFAKAEQKVLAAQKRRKNSVHDAALLQKFAGQFPPSLLKIMSGESTSDGIGFHQIAMQIAITAGALGKKDDVVLPLCEGLIANHKSDGARYNTPPKRRAELQRMLRYCEDNVCYSYSRDAVRKLLPVGVPAPDLDGLTESSGTVISVDGEVPDDGMLGGVFMTELGVFRKAEEGVQKISNIAFKDVSVLVDATSGRALGYEVDVLLDGKSRGLERLSIDTFLSKAKYQVFAMTNGGVMQGSDNHVAALSVKLRELAMQKGGTVYVVHREGLDLVQRPDTDIKDMLWVTPDEVIGLDLPLRYRFQAPGNREAMFKSDLMEAPDLECNEETVKVLSSLLQMNSPFVMGALLAWMTSAFHRQIYHELYGQFPLCQMFGQAGSGKTTTLDTLLRFFYYLSPPISFTADGGTTKYSLEGMMQTSASIPAAIEEYKPREMRPGRHAQLKQMFRSAYNSQAFAKGGMGVELGQSWRDISVFNYSAPVIFIGEALEAETAVLERTVVIPLSKQSLTGREEHHRIVFDNRKVISALGKEIVKATFATDLDQFKASMDANEQRARAIAFHRNNHRVVFNLAVLFNGLDFLEQVLEMKFGKMFKIQFAELRTALGDVSNQVATAIMTEASKVLNTLAFISRTEDAISEFGLQYGRDYVYSGTGKNLGSLQMRMRDVWVKYVGWCRRKGQPQLFDNEDAFLHGFAHYSALEDKVCLKSVLKLNGLDKVYSFRVLTLDEEKVETFKHPD
jgi:hypothetical protein